MLVVPRESLSNKPFPELSQPTTGLASRNKSFLDDSERDLQEEMVQAEAWGSAIGRGAPKSLASAFSE